MLWLRVLLLREIFYANAVAAAYADNACAVAAVANAVYADAVCVAVVTVGACAVFVDAVCCMLLLYCALASRDVAAKNVAAIGAMGPI